MKKRVLSKIEIRVYSIYKQTLTFVGPLAWMQAGTLIVRVLSIFKSPPKLDMDKSPTAPFKFWNISERVSSFIENWLWNGGKFKANLV